MKKINILLVLVLMLAVTFEGYSQQRRTTTRRAGTTTTTTPAQQQPAVTTPQPPQQAAPAPIQVLPVETPIPIAATAQPEKTTDKDVPMPLLFFNDLGAIRVQNTEMDALADTIVKQNPRADDVVWSRTVYRVIDMREKQNFQLYFPMRPNDQYRSLFRVILDAITEGVQVYKRNPRDIKPDFKETLSGFELSRIFAYDEDNDNNLLQVDTITEQRSVSMDQYMQYVKNQLKFLIQEVVYFDRHTSRLSSKIIAIAPMYALHPDNMEQRETMNYFRNSVLCWIPFDELRPYLVKQNVIPSGNDSERLTFDDFFQQKLYSSYLLGDSNMYSRMLLDYVVDENKLKAEQARIETELLNFEQDLWEY